MIKVDGNTLGYDKLFVGNIILTLVRMLVVLCELLRVVFCVRADCNTLRHRMISFIFWLVVHEEVWSWALDL
jgi:hypothetical protein